MIRYSAIKNDSSRSWARAGRGGQSG